MIWSFGMYAGKSYSEKNMENWNNKKSKQRETKDHVEQQHARKRKSYSD